MKHIILVTVLFASSFASYGQDKQLVKLINQVSESSLKTNLYKFTDSTFEGRMASTRGDSLSSQFIADWYQLHNLKAPFHKEYPYYQLVPLIEKKYTIASLSLEAVNYPVYGQWSYSDISPNKKVEDAEVAFIGFGSSAPSFNELKNIDIKNKVLILFADNNPVNDEGKPLIPENELKDFYQRFDALKDAAAFFLYWPNVEFEIAREKEDRKRRSFKQSTEEVPPAPLFIISKSLANDIVSTKGITIDSLAAIIKTSGKPQSFNTGKKISLQLARKDSLTASQNIIGIIEGADTNAACIVVTAHHDHLGKTEDGVYYGADDNGSGTIALMEIARILGEASKTGIRPKRTIIFLSTAAEEHGEIGSLFYVEHPIIPLNKTYCTINIDMLGRVDSFYTGRKPDSNYLYVLLSDTSKNVINKQLLTKLNTNYTQLILDTLYENNPDNLISRSDQYSFMKKGIPAIQFFSGFHKDYHKPTDTPDKINYPLFRRRVQLVFATLWTLANE